MKRSELLAIMATIIYAADGIEAAVIASSERPEWEKPADDATPRISTEEAVDTACELLVRSAGRWHEDDE